MKRTLILTILDGWGIGKPDISNPIYNANLKNIQYLKEHYPLGALQASGIAVGLPWGEEGNSEVGHLTIGAGKVLYQHFPRISLAVRDGSFFENKVLKDAFNFAVQNNSAVNLIGLLTEGNVHASFEHLIGLVEMAARKKISRLNFHLFADGKDGPPRSAISLLGQLDGLVKKYKIGTLASLSGRYYAMDREGYWDRTEQAYRVITGEGEAATDPKIVLEKTFERGLNEEFLKPKRFGSSGLGVRENDAVIFFNFREDSMRQIAESFINPNFQRFPVKQFKSVYFCSLTRYRDNFTMPVAFPPERVDVPLGKVFENNGKNQLRIAETEKYAHATYFFNGLRDAPYDGEFRVLIPSRNVARMDEAPEMMAAAVTDRVVSSLGEGGFDFILVNFANADVIAHTGNYDASLSAVKTIDESLGILYQTIRSQNYIWVITADHGNAERLFDPLTAIPETKHDPNPVPIIVVAKEFERLKTADDVKAIESESVGILADVSPTILDLLNLEKPKEMSGQSLLKFLR
ncbi:MAG: 2,3-bisphosphoglycerate-independent phosphoglycerate mutase [Candidatus Brennerbacteria bacterium]|nr:2,3-bisphosphoglycerate-independent phosphoglycerate mutase [Candidatus Brennerbacteria bacterium]